MNIDWLPAKATSTGLRKHPHIKKAQSKGLRKKVYRKLLKLQPLWLQDLQPIRAQVLIKFAVKVKVKLRD